MFVTVVMQINLVKLNSLRLILFFFFHFQSDRFMLDEDDSNRFGNQFHIVVYGLGIA